MEHSKALGRFCEVKVVWYEHGKGSTVSAKSYDGDQMTEGYVFAPTESQVQLLVDEAQRLHFWAFPNLFP